MFSCSQGRRLHNCRSVKNHQMGPGVAVHTQETGTQGGRGRGNSGWTTVRPCLKIKLKRESRGPNSAGSAAARALSVVPTGLSGTPWLWVCILPLRLSSGLLSVPGEVTGAPWRWGPQDHHRAGHGLRPVALHLQEGSPVSQLLRGRPRALRGESPAWAPPRPSVLDLETAPSFMKLPLGGFCSRLSSLLHFARPLQMCPTLPSHPRGCSLPVHHQPPPNLGAVRSDLSPCSRADLKSRTSPVPHATPRATSLCVHPPRTGVSPVQWGSETMEVPVTTEALPHVGTEPWKPSWCELRL